ncbi:hypothetical protein BCS65_20010 [Vibrio cyclitrophicus]
MKKLEHSILIKIFYMIPVVDVLLGVATIYLGLYSGNEQNAKMVTLIPGMLIRLMAFLLMFKMSFTKDRVLLLFLVFSFLLLFFTEVRGALINQEQYSSFALGMIYIYKIYFILVSYVFFVRIDPVFGKDIAGKIIPFSFFIYSLAIILGTLSGQYFTTYGGSGSSGWLIKGSANSISIIFAPALAILLPKLYKSNYGMSKCLFVIFLALQASLLMLTKVSTFSILIISLSFFLLYAKLFHRVIIILLLLLSSVMMVGYLMDTDLFNRLEFVYEYYDGNIFYLLLSGRHEHVIAAFNVLDSMSVFDIIFGNGYAYFREYMSVYLTKVMGVEIDIFDLFFMNGILFTVVYFSIIIYVCFRAVMNLFSSVNDSMKMLSISYLLLVLVSFLAGHVLMSGLNGHLLPIMASTICFKRVKI